MKAMHTYTIVLDYDDEERMFTVTVPALPGCITQGHTREEAIQRAQEAIATHLAGLRAAGLAIPAESQPPEVVRVSVAA